MSPRKKTEHKTIKIQLVRSGIGYTKRQKLTIEALGIRRLGQVVEQKDTPQVRGMVRKITHLVKVLEE